MKNFYAVIIGFNDYMDQNLPSLKFAEKDATDLYNILTDPSIGNVHKENIQLITGNISRQELETELYTHAVQKRNTKDTVLIYFSGHSFIAGEI